VELAASRLAEPTRKAQMDASQAAWRAKHDRQVAAYEALPFPDKTTRST
jgi:hypothetical protein